MKRWLLSLKDNVNYLKIDEKDEINFYIDKYAKKGDIVAIYASPCTHISHFFTVKESSPYEYGDFEKEKYQMIIYKKFKLPVPIPLKEMKEYSVLDGWITRFPNFIYEMPADTWIKMMNFILEKNPELIKPNTKQYDTKNKKIRDYMDIEHIIEFVQSCAEKSNNIDDQTCCKIPLNEASTEQTIIRPILRYLGWNIDDLCDLNPEYNIGPKRVDYVLNYGNSNKLFIEVKNFNRDLTKENENQLIDYCDSKNVNLGLLTNGKIWQFFYLTYEKSNYISNRQKICEIDALKDDKKKIIELFSQLLSKEAIKSGKAFSFAEELSQNK
ncbi:MAG: type I restriction enzyme HsdR N-terminal domain-containing protein [Methanobacterium sp.]|nr:type I restriction enzyme HsdR N-terminal domain-containing protein [Methanobacterium sp.]